MAQPGTVMGHPAYKVIVTPASGTYPQASSLHPPQRGSIPVQNDHGFTVSKASRPSSKLRLCNSNRENKVMDELSEVDFPGFGQLSGQLYILMCTYWLA